MLMLHQASSHRLPTSLKMLRMLWMRAAFYGFLTEFTAFLARV
jgi:hypothetical protein